MQRRNVFWLLMLFLLFLSGVETYSAITSTAKRGHITALIILSVGIIALLYVIIQNSNKYKYTIYLLYYACSPEAYIMQIKLMLRAELRKKHPRQLGKLKLCLSDGLTAAGRFQESLDNLPAAGFLQQSRLGQLNLVWYHHCRCTNYLFMGDTHMAELSLDHMKHALDELASSADAVRFRQRYAENAAWLSIARGDYAAAEPVFASSFQQAHHNFGRTAAQFALGEIYRHTNRLDDAAKAYRYVIENGNKLHIVALATAFHPVTAR